MIHFRYNKPSWSYRCWDYIYKIRIVKISFQMTVIYLFGQQSIYLRNLVNFFIKGKRFKVLLFAFSLHHWFYISYDLISRTLVLRWWTHFNRIRLFRSLLCSKLRVLIINVGQFTLILYLFGFLWTSDHFLSIKKLWDDLFACDWSLMVRFYLLSNSHLIVNTWGFCWSGILLRLLSR